jgi:hypothetical protein
MVIVQQWFRSQISGVELSNVHQRRIEPDYQKSLTPWTISAEPCWSYERIRAGVLMGVLMPTPEALQAAAGCSRAEAEARAARLAREGVK